VNFNPQTPWFPAAAWIAFVVVGSLVVEAFCIATGRPKISNCVWWLIANYPIQMVVVTVALLVHFWWQASMVYSQYRRKDKTDV